MANLISRPATKGTPCCCPNPGETNVTKRVRRNPLERPTSWRNLASFSTEI